MVSRPGASLASKGKTCGGASRPRAEPRARSWTRKESPRFGVRFLMGKNHSFNHGKGMRRATVQLIKQHPEQQGPLEFLPTKAFPYYKLNFCHSDFGFDGFGGYSATPWQRWPL